jgi:hypothetical protein
MRRALGIGVGAGLVLGLATRLVYELPREWWWLAKVGGPWLAVAFGSGLTLRKPRNGALAGGVCPVVATLVYYSIMLLQHTYEASPLGLAWLLVAVPAGLVFGALGSAARNPSVRIPAAATLSAAFAAEAVLTADRSSVGPGALLVAALVMPLALGRSHREQGLAFGWVAALTVVAAGAGGVVLGLTGYT